MSKCSANPADGAFSEKFASFDSKSVKDLRHQSQGSFREALETFTLIASSAGHLDQARKVSLLA